MTFEEFATARLPGLLRYATVLTADPTLAQDIVQDVMVKACARWDRVRAADRPDDYVRRMIVNEHLSWRRRWQVRSVRASADTVLHAAQASTADHAGAVADRDEVRRRLARLAPRQRTVVVLHYYQGLDDVAIAALLGVPPSTVRSTLSRALASLRRAELPPLTVQPVEEVRP
jgi:RNA polymerase sigma-70 factor (sigma-E family)